LGQEPVKTYPQITLDGDDFIRWGLHAVLKWNNNELPKNLIHIHGNKDTVFPISGTNPSHSIPGGHMLMLENASAVNSILEDLLAD
jgi:hypothetical protein